MHSVLQQSEYIHHINDYPDHPSAGTEQMMTTMMLSSTSNNSSRNCTDVMIRKSTDVDVPIFKSSSFSSSHEQDAAKTMDNDSAAVIVDDSIDEQHTHTNKRMEKDNQQQQGVSREKASVPHKKKRPTKKKNNRKSSADGLPKRPLSAYNLFFQAQRDKMMTLKDENGTLVQDEEGNTSPPQMLGKIIGKLWRELDSKEKQIYQDMADQDCERYRREIEAMHLHNTKAVTRSESPQLDYDTPPSCTNTVKVDSKFGFMISPSPFIHHHEHNPTSISPWKDCQPVGVTMPPGMEIVLNRPPTSNMAPGSSRRQETRKYRLHYSCFSMPRMEAEKYFETFLSQPTAFTATATGSWGQDSTRGHDNYTQHGFDHRGADRVGRHYDFVHAKIVTDRSHSPSLYSNSMS
jgi:hypothetical protein